HPNALLRRGTTIGTDRAGGGEWERPAVDLFVFGRDGLLERLESFEPDRVADALARFDELTAEPPRAARRVRPNAATAAAARIDAAFAARDADAIAASVH